MKLLYVNNLILTDQQTNLYEDLILTPVLKYF